MQRMQKKSPTYESVPFDEMPSNLLPGPTQGLDPGDHSTTFFGSVDVCQDHPVLLVLEPPGALIHTDECGNVKMAAACSKAALQRASFISSLLIAVSHALQRAESSNFAKHRSMTGSGYNSSLVHTRHSSSLHPDKTVPNDRVNRSNPRI